MAVTKNVSHLLAGDSWVPVTEGVKHVRDLVVSQDQVAIVRPDGTIGTAVVRSLTPKTNAARCSSLLLTVGEILLPEGTRVVTRRGIQPSVDVEGVVQSGQAVRIEVVQPEDIFAGVKPMGSRRDSYRSAIASFPREVVAIPRWLEAETQVCREVESVFRTAGVRFERHHSDDWLVYSFDKPGPPHSSKPWPRPGDQFDALRLLTAWTVEGGQFVARVLENETALFQRLTGSLAGSQQRVQVRWVPGYRPVEAQILPRVSSQATSHVPVSRVTLRAADVFEVVLDRAGFVILGLALVA